MGNGGEGGEKQAGRQVRGKVGEEKEKEEEEDDNMEG